jgi:hypothetical protein
MIVGQEKASSAKSLRVPERPRTLHSTADLGYELKSRLIYSL